MTNTWGNDLSQISQVQRVPRMATNREEFSWVKLMGDPLQKDWKEVVKFKISRHRHQITRALPAKGP